MSVQLIIKSAAQSEEDFKLNCEMSWTIAQIKDQLTVHYPSKPERNQQKLIYGGKLLPDHLPLTSILNPTNEIHILHLVCPIPSKLDASKSNANKGKNESSACTLPPLNPNGIYPQQLPTSVFSNSPSVGSAFPFNPPADAFHQYMAMQQMYNQFLTQYLSQQYNTTVTHRQVPATAPPVQQPVPPLPRRNDNDEERVDTLDAIYIMCRLVLLVGVLIYYSSPPRIIAVVVLLILVTWFSKMNRERQEGRERQQRANERQSANNENIQNNERESEISENPETINENASTDSPNHSQTRSVPFTIMTAITSFFTSLIPEDVEHLEIN